MQSFQERDQGSCFRRIQVLRVSGHVAASLDNLADQLVLRESYGDGVERWASLAAGFSKRTMLQRSCQSEGTERGDLHW